jgi:hypothetical protein
MVTRMQLLQLVDSRSGRSPLALASRSPINARSWDVLIVETPGAPIGVGPTRLADRTPSVIGKPVSASSGTFRQERDERPVHLAGVFLSEKIRYGVTQISCSEHLTHPLFVLQEFARCVRNFSDMRVGDCEIPRNSWIGTGARLIRGTQSTDCFFVSPDTNERHAKCEIPHESRPHAAIEPNGLFQQRDRFCRPPDCDQRPGDRDAEMARRSVQRRVRLAGTRTFDGIAARWRGGTSRASR